MQTALPFGPDSSAPAALDAMLRHAPAPAAGAWDEWRHADGSVRSVWRRFAALLPGAGDEAVHDLDRRVAQVAQQLRRDGVTHNVFDDAGVATRPWSLELLPLLIEAHDWVQIERGVQQRAALLEALLADLYGAQRVLHEGLLPPALLMRHPGYLRAMHGAPPVGGQRLLIVAFDLARREDGGWSVIGQRTQGPSGLGYVLHNRLVIAGQFPDAFRELRVQHLASSYRRLLDSIEQRAQALTAGPPRVVLLTPGRYSEAYFEHAYLARYLGLPLVEGGDLTVRGAGVFLKTMDGLEPVHGVLRRVDDDWCDPLELRPDSALGVPGLLHAARAGQVVLANALGSAVLESPALHGFMPGVARRLLGEDLLLAALPTWWCGEAAAWHSVRDRLGDKLLRSAFPAGGRPPAPAADAAAAIAADPDAWALHDRLRYARAPIWKNGRAVPRPAVLRVFAVADEAGRWHVLPGGMTRVAQDDRGSVSMHRGGSSLDTWVLTTGHVDTFSMLPPRLAVDDIARRRRPVTSRTAENLFWMGRYTERTEQLVRLAQVVLACIDADDEAQGDALEALSRLAVRQGLAPAAVPSLVRAPHVFGHAVRAGLAGAEDSGYSVAYCLRALERASQGLRERLSGEQWGLIRALQDALPVAQGGAEPPPAQDWQPVLGQLGLQLAALTGLQTDRMTRDHGWRLLAVGRLIERLIGVAARFEVFAESAALGQGAGTDLLLELFDSAITFRARYQRRDDLLALVDLLVLDETNPRAFAGVLRRLRAELGKLPGDAASTAALLAHLPAAGVGLSLETLRGADDAQLRARVQALSVHLGETASRLAEDIGQRYFAHADAGQALRRV